MKAKLNSLLVIIMLTLTTAFTCPAQTVPDDWNGLKNLPDGTPLIVETQSGETIRASVSSVTDAVLHLASRGGAVSLDKTEVSEIFLTRKSSRIKRALFGAGIGAAVGLAATGIYMRANRNADPLTGAAGLLYGLPAGAVIGAATGGKARKGRRIYKSN